MLHMFNQYDDECDEEGVVFRKRQVIGIDHFLQVIFVRRLFAITLLIIMMILLSRIEVNGADENLLYLGTEDNTCSNVEPLNTVF